MDCREDDPEPQVIFSKHLGVKMEVTFIGAVPHRTHENHSVMYAHGVRPQPCTHCGVSPLPLTSVSSQVPYCAKTNGYL